jgi:hypothetical protein
MLMVLDLFFISIATLFGFMMGIITAYVMDCNNVRKNFD